MSVPSEDCNIQLVEIQPNESLVNTAVHLVEGRSLAIDIEKVYRHLQKDLKDFDRFARSIAQYLKKI